LTSPIPHVDADLAGVDLASVATPLALAAHWGRAPLGDTTGITGDDAIGGAQPIHHLSNQPPDQRSVLPGDGADELWEDEALDIDQRRHVLSILARQVGEQPLEIALHMALSGRGLAGLLLGHDERAQPVHHVHEHVWGNEAVP
jgi:hypothetical protein